MSEEIIYGCRIENNGDVNKGLEYLRNHWNDRYVLDVFENARTSTNHFGDFKINDINGTYVPFSTLSLVLDIMLFTL